MTSDYLSIYLSIYLSFIYLFIYLFIYPLTNKRHCQLSFKQLFDFSKLSFTGWEVNTIVRVKGNLRLPADINELKTCALNIKMCWILFAPWESHSHVITDPTTVCSMGMWLGYLHLWPERVVPRIIPLHLLRERTQVILKWDPINRAQIYKSGAQYHAVSHTCIEERTACSNCRYVSHRAPAWERGGKWAGKVSRKRGEREKEWGEERGVWGK